MLSSPQLALAGIMINIGNKSGCSARQPALPERGHAARVERDAAAGVRGGDRPHRAEQGRLSTGLFRPSCTLIPAADTLWYDQTKVPCTPYDPVEARKLVAKSGFPTPITVHLLTANNTGLLRLAQFVQAQEAAAGFNVVIDLVDQPTLMALLVSGRFDTAIYQYGTDPEPNTLVSRALNTSGASNYTGYSNPRLDYVLNNGLEASSFKARAVNYRVAQQIIRDDRPIIVLYARLTFAAFSSSLLTGVQLTAVGGYNLANAQFIK